MNQKDDVLVEVKGVSKKFSRSLKQSMWYGFKDMGSALFGINGNRSALREGEFWAVKEVSFSLRRGECLGLIGHNGAGKSTLLKMLNGLIRPDEGSITMRGKIGALIELGAGFNPLLTGRENVFINGQLLGFSRKEIEKKLDAILDFAEIGEFIDSPVQNYSSGMKVRLGFAVAAQMEPDVMIIDEVLAVGDLGFRVKCMNRINEILGNTAVIFVSHAMTQITTICTQLLLMEHGQIEYQGNNIGHGVEKYFSNFSVSNQQIISSNKVFLKHVALIGSGVIENMLPCIESGEKLELIFELESTLEIENLKFRIGIFNIEYRLLAEVDSEQHNFIAKKKDGKFKVSVIIDDLYLRYGKYSIHLHVIDALKNEKLLRQSDIASFMVRPTLSIGADFLLPSKWKIE
jgi:lipopolysaccharide transport system ATP-binding protein